MGNCCRHDWIDILAALGPTLATIFAGTATVLVYLRGERFQRRLVRPLIVVRQQIESGTPFWQWRVEIRNEGQGAANIESFVVVAADEIVTFEAMRKPSEYWNDVLLRSGATRVQQVKGNILMPPFSIGAGASHLLFEAQVAGQAADVDTIVRKLEIRGKYSSSFGEQNSFRSRFGRDDR